jgi:transposase
MPFVCVQPMITSWSRRAEDLSHDKTGEKDAVLIARLSAQLRCYEPEPVDETWARLRQLGVHREQLIIEATSQVQQMRDLLDCVWPAVLNCARSSRSGRAPGSPRSVWWSSGIAAIWRAPGGWVGPASRLRFDA